MATKGEEVDGKVDDAFDPDFVPRVETWRDFLYNPDKGTVLGRTGCSWLKIGIFYIIFYCFLIGWFAGLLHAFYSSLDDIAPKYYGKDSLTQANPALGVRPMPTYDTTLIRFTLDQRSSYQPYTDHLDAFFKTYDMSSDAMNCTGNMTSSPTKACNVDVEEYLREAGCTREKDYGYGEGKPCVVIKMNKLFGFEALPYESVEEIENDLEEYERFRYYSFAPGNIGISCDGQNDVDSQHLKAISMFPTNGLDKKFFPYMNQPGYQSPFILAKFDNIEMEMTVQVKCVLWAKNIDNTDGKQLKGSIHFEFYIN